MATFDGYPLLKISNSPILSQFLHECVDDLIGKKPKNFDNYNSDIEWTIEDYNKASKLIQTFYRQCIFEDNYNLKATDLAANVEEAIRNCFELRKQDIFQALAKESILKNGHNLVENIDWKLKWIMGSSKLASLKEPLLQIDLHCIQKSQERNENSRNTVNFEMNLKQVNELIQSLQRSQDEIK